ncbi:UNVERIFIED_CONTAM: hypothetical protein PYX00_011761 [Menopon gallinae]|uniref:Homeobox domain-containing protein n=1 Tax=Menopon gallinae TaxID=328185 RepID=A0AAW2H8M4_9NEOP
MALMKTIVEFQNILRDRIKDEFGDITCEELAEKVLVCEEFLVLEKDLNNILLSLDLKHVDSTFKRIDTAQMLPPERPFGSPGSVRVRHASSAASVSHGCLTSVGTRRNTVRDTIGSSVPFWNQKPREDAKTRRAKCPTCVVDVLYVCAEDTCLHFDGLYFPIRKSQNIARYHIVYRRNWKKFERVMGKERNALAPLVLKLASCEAEYIQSSCTRNDLEENVQNIQMEYKNIDTAPSRRDRYYLAMLLLFLERVRISVALEDEIIEIVDTESALFDGEVMRIIKDMERVQSEIASAEDTMGHLSRESPSERAKRTNYPKHVSGILRKWLQENMKNPYPSDTEKVLLREKTGLDATQLNNWFINARRRILPFLREAPSYQKR